MFIHLIGTFIQSDIDVRQFKHRAELDFLLTWLSGKPGIWTYNLLVSTTQPSALTFQLSLITKHVKSKTGLEGREKSEVINDFFHLAPRAELWKLHQSSVWALVVSAINVFQLEAPSLLASLNVTYMRWVVIIGQKVEFAMHK